MKKIAICMSLLISQAWGLSCSTPITISEPGQNADWPCIKLNQEGQALITWKLRDPDTEEEKIVAATMNSEKKWSQAGISGMAKHNFDKRTFVDASGNSFALWETVKEGDIRYHQFAKKEKNQDWTPGTILVSPEDKMSHLNLTFDSKGNVLIFGTRQVQDSKDSGRTHYRAVAVDYLHEKGQRKETEISKAENGYVVAELLVKNKKENIFVLWSENRSTYDAKKGYQSEKNLRGSWLQPDASWSIPEKLSTVDSGGDFSGFRGLMNSKRDMVIAWNKNNTSSGLYELHIVTYLDGKWSDPLELAKSKNCFFNFKLYLNDQGHVLASWTKTEKGQEVVYVADKPVGQPWSSPIALSNSDTDLETVESFLDHEGNIIVVWTGKKGKKDVIYVADKPVGQSWSPLAVLSDPSKNVRELELCKDNEGNALVVWTLKEGREKVPYAAYKPAHQSWTPSVCLTDGTQNCVGLQLKSDHHGHFVVLWKMIQNKQASIQGAVLSTATQEWTSSVLSPEGQSCEYFNFKFNKKGQGLIVWNIEDDEEEYLQVAELNVN